MKHFTLEEKYNLIKQVCTENLSNGEIIIWDVWIGNLDIIHKIAEALDVSVSYFIENKENKDEIELLKKEVELLRKENSLLKRELKLKK